MGAVGDLVKANLALQELGNRVAQRLGALAHGRTDEADLTSRR
jgi:hypothetical protein